MRRRAEIAQERGSRRRALHEERPPDARVERRTDKHRVGGAARGVKGRLKLRRPWDFRGPGSRPRLRRQQLRPRGLVAGRTVDTWADMDYCDVADWLPGMLATYATRLTAADAHGTAATLLRVLRPNTVNVDAQADSFLSIAAEPDTIIRTTVSVADSSTGSLRLGELRAAVAGILAAPQ